MELYFHRSYMLELIAVCCVWQICTLKAQLKACEHVQCLTLFNGQKHVIGFIKDDFVRTSFVSFYPNISVVCLYISLLSRWFQISFW